MEGFLVILNLSVTIIGLIGIVVRFSNKFALLEKKVDDLEEDNEGMNKNMIDLQANFNKLILEMSLLRKDFQQLNSTLLTTVNKLDTIVDTTNTNILKINNIETLCKFNHLKNNNINNE